MENYRILVDDAADQPALGFHAYAQALAGIIKKSNPHFAIGIFGDWGFGKTTLLRAIEREVAADPTVITVWFNPWRYEREEHLIVPLLDTLRDALVGWAVDQAREPTLRDRAVKTASIIGKVARAILIGLKIKAGVPGAGLEFEPGKAIADWEQQQLKEAAEEPQSFYYSSFKILRETLSTFADGGRQRIVIFVDDLDRCLPENALQVLDSIKIVFDFEGIVFVVGLDWSVVERAIDAKYQSSYAADDQSRIKGSEYIKKIFQIPFTLPPIAPEQLFDFFETMSSTISQDQHDDMRMRVTQHFYYVTTDAGINPRDVKRYINAYTLLQQIRPDLNPDIVLCLQTISFRTDWEDAYEAFLAEPEVFIEAVRRQLNGEKTAVVSLWPNLDIPDLLLQYLDSMGKPLLEANGLDRYIQSIESTRSTQTGLAAAYRVFGRLNGLLREFDVTESDERRRAMRTSFAREIPGLRRTLMRMSHSRAGATLLSYLDQPWWRPIPLDAVQPETSPGHDSQLDEWRQSIGEGVERIRTGLREMRRGSASS